MTWATFSKRAYQVARDWGMAPSEFWKLSPLEWWWEFDAKVEANARLTGSRGGFSKAQWDEARRKHKERFG